MIEECGGKSYKERIQILGLTKLKTRRARADMLEVFKILKGYEGINGDCFFRIQLTKTSGYSMKFAMTKQCNGPNDPSHSMQLSIISYRYTDGGAPCNVR